MVSFLIVDSAGMARVRSAIIYDTSGQRQNTIQNSVYYIAVAFDSATTKVVPPRRAALAGNGLLICINVVVPMKNDPTYCSTCSLLRMRTVVQRLSPRQSKISTKLCKHCDDFLTADTELFITHFSMR